MVSCSNCAVWWVPGGCPHGWVYFHALNQGANFQTVIDNFTKRVKINMPCVKDEKLFYAFKKIAFSQYNTYSFWSKERYPVYNNNYVVLHLELAPPLSLKNPPLKNPYKKHIACDHGHFQETVFIYY